jgi:hypothetical protein
MKGGLRVESTVNTMGGPMSESLQHVVGILRRAGLTQLAEEAQRTLPDPVDRKELERFGAEHGLSQDVLAERMGGSP